MAKARKAHRKRTGSSTSGGEPLCTFCGKTHAEVARLISGPGVYICDGCVAICNGILEDPQYQDGSAGWQGWSSMSDEALLATLPGALRSAETVRDGVQARVDELRRREISWAKIGDALSMSRQAAWERFA